MENQNSATTPALQVGASIPQGATIGEPQAQSQTQQGGLTVGAPIPQGATIGNSDEIRFNGNEGFGEGLAKLAGGTAEGIGEGVFGTLAGGANIVNKLTGQKPGAITNELHHLAGEDNTTHGLPQEFGQGLETVGEFLMGDAALKGLSQADRFLKVSKALKLIEGNSRLARALTLGIGVGKAGVELSPDERALLQQYPKLAKLAGIAMDSLRAGETQGAQTLIKSSGDTKQAAIDAATMAGGSAVVGGTLGAVGHVLESGGKAANAVDTLRTAAENAPTATEAGSQLEKTVGNVIHPQQEAAQTALDEAQGHINAAATIPETLAKTAPPNEEIAASTQKAVQGADAALKNAYGESAKKLVAATEGEALDYKDSPLEDTAKTLMGQAKTEEHPLDKAFNKTRPGSPIANERVKTLADPYAEENEEIQKQNDKLEKQKVNGPKPEPTELKNLDDHPITMDMQYLIDSRKKVGEWMRETGYQTDEQRADRKIYGQLLDGIDESISQLTQQANKPEAIKILDDMNTAYRTGIKKFDNPDVQMLLEGKHGDVFKRLISGGTAVHDINNLRSTIGDEAFSKFANDGISRMAADSVDKDTGEFSFKKFFNTFNAIPADKRAAMLYNSVNGKAISDALGYVQHTNATGVIPESTAKLKELTNTMTDLLGNGRVDSLIKDPERVQRLSALVGPDAMSELGKTVLQNQIREASTNAAGNIGNIDANKFLNFVKSLKDSPEVTDALFKPTPESAKAYNKLMEDVKNVQSVKNMVKAGIIVPVLTAGAVAGSHLGSAVIGLLAAGGTEFAAKDLIEKMANSPKTWTALKFLDKAAQHPLAQTAGETARYITGKAGGQGVNYLRNAMQATQGQLSQ